MLLNTSITSSIIHHPHISLLNQTLGFTITNISAPYAICGSVIVVCMLATTLRNLIYKVLNLAVLSVFVVATWAYLTDVTFIYVVYILTFVSAVVMLFLSVVLMLPSSALAVSKRSTVPSIFTLSTSNFEYEGLFYLFICSAVVFVPLYLIAAFTRPTHYNKVYTGQNLSTKVVMVDYNMQLIKADKSLQNFIEANDFYLINRFSSAANILERHCKIFDYCRFSRSRKSPPITGSYSLLVVPNFNAFYISKFPGAKALLAVVYEFMNFYVHCLEPKSFLHNSAYVKATSSLRSFVRAKSLDLDSNFYYLGQKCSITFTPKSDSTGTMQLYSPWWSPFKIFDALDIFIKLLSRWSLKIKRVLVVPDGSIVYHFFINTFRLHPLLIDELANTNLRYAVTQLINRGLSCAKLSNFLNNFAKMLGAVYNNFSYYLEVCVQAVIMASIFLIALPYGLAGKSFLDYSIYITRAVASDLENLAAIQQSLYADQPMLLLVCITGLLVALVGAPFFVAKDSR